MSRLPRPYIPLAVRVQVAARQLCEAGFTLRAMELVGSGERSDGALLQWLLFVELKFERGKVHLDHDPPLAARMRRTKLDGSVVFSPNANDPRFLIYRTPEAHRFKTNVAGEHGQHPDRVLIKKARRLERKARPKPKRKWAKRPFLKGRGFERRAT